MAPLAGRKNLLKCLYISRLRHTNVYVSMAHGNDKNIERLLQKLSLKRSQMYLHYFHVKNAGMGTL